MARPGPEELTSVCLKKRKLVAARVDVVFDNWLSLHIPLPFHFASARQLDYFDQPTIDVFPPKFNEASNLEDFKNNDIRLLACIYSN